MSDIRHNAMLGFQSLIFWGGVRICGLVDNVVILNTFFKSHQDKLEGIFHP